MKFEENWPRGFRSRSKVWMMNGRTMDDGRQVITIAHPKPSAQVS